MTKLTCTNPIPAYLEHYYHNGKRRDKIRLFKAEDYLQHREPNQLIPCRKCKACRLAERNRWVGRIMQEAQETKPAYFITLTYATSTGKLNYKDVQDFFKRLRKKSPRKIKYLTVGEYGSKYGREHWHILTFGLKLDDLKFYKLSTNGAYYLSDTLRETWRNGHILISEFSDAVAKYVAGYTLKKHDEELILKCSKGFGLYKDKEALETFTRPNGSGLSPYEKQLLRKRFGNYYYERADEIRKETTLKRATKKDAEEIEKIFERIYKKY